MGCIVGMNEIYNQYENRIKEDSLRQDTYSFFSEEYSRPEIGRTALRSLKIDFTKL